MSKRDYYEVLEISREAEATEIKKSFRRLAMKHHPDRNPGDHAAEEKFKEIKEAYEVLSDSQKRQMYDQFGHAGAQQSAGGGAGGFSFGDIFEEFFGGGGFGGGGRGQQRGQAGSDLRYDLALSLEDAIRGKSVKITIPTWVECNACDGKGAKKGTSPTHCPTCEGAGQVHLQQGFFTVQQTCPSCRGAGKVIKEPCSSCRGAGRRRSEKTLSVKVPAGVDNGDRVRLAGEGEAGMHGGPAGDLYVQIFLNEHPVFKREGNNLHCEIPIDFSIAALGGEIDVPTLDGRVKLRIPSETQTGKLFRLRGKGVKSLRDRGTGDLVCRAILETPVNLNKQQKELLKAFDAAIQESDAKHSPRSQSWLDKVKNFFENLAA